MGRNIALILEGHFLRFWGPTCLHFGVQVEAQNRESHEFKLKINARGFQEAPRASQEGLRASQERPKSAPRAAQTSPGASKTHSSGVRDCSKSTQKQPRAQNQGSALQKHRKIGKSIENEQKYKIVKQFKCKISAVKKVKNKVYWCTDFAPKLKQFIKRFMGKGEISTAGRGGVT